MRSRYKRIQLYRSDLQEVSDPIRNKLKSLFQGKLFIFRANWHFQGKFFPPPSKMPSRTSMYPVVIDQKLTSDIKMIFVQNS